MSYLRIPARDVAQSADFHRAVFGWRLRGDPHKPSFSDGTSHVGHWPYIYGTIVDDTLRAVAEHGGDVVTAPYPEGDLWVATIRDPAGNVIGIWQDGPRCGVRNTDYAPLPPHLPLAAAPDAMMAAIPLDRGCRRRDRLSLAGLLEELTRRQSYRGQSAVSDEFSPVPPS